MGHVIEFSCPPPDSGVRPTPWPSCLTKRSELSLGITALLQKGAIQEVPPLEVGLGFYSRIFLVPKLTGGFRLVLDLKALNKWVVRIPFRMETLQRVIPLVLPGHYMCTLDLQDAYYHVPIHPQSRRFLRFCVQGRHFQFLVLPFGLRSAPRVFTKVVAPVVAVLHLRGLLVYPYLDDWLIHAPSQSLLLEAQGVVCSVLRDHGFLLNLPKCQLSPSQDLVFIGARFRTDLGRVFLPVPRILTLVSLARRFLQGDSFPVRLWLRLLGLMAATVFTVAWARFHLHPLWLYLLSRWNPVSLELDVLLPVSPSVLPALLWWSVSEHLSQGLPLQPSPPVTLTTDASSFGWGATLGSLSLQGRWSLPESRRSSNWRELSAVFRAVMGFRVHLLSRHVLVRSDNTVTVAYLNRQGGVRSSSLNAVVIPLFCWAEGHLLSLSAVHIRGVDNGLADALSRCFPASLELSLTPVAFRLVCRRFGLPFLDLFASRLNAQLPRFCSRGPQEGCWGVDALSIPWPSRLLYAFPPLALIPRFLARMCREDRVVVVVLPFWPRRSWFPTLRLLAVQGPWFLPLSPSPLRSAPSLPLRRLRLSVWKLRGKVGVGEVSLNI